MTGAVFAALIGLLGVLLQLSVLTYLGTMALVAIGLFFASKHHAYLKTLVANLTAEKDGIQRELVLERAATQRAEEEAAAAGRRASQVESDGVRRLQEAQKNEKELILQHQVEVKRISSDARAKGAQKFKAIVMARVSPFGASRPKVSAPFGFSPDAFYGAQHHKDIRVMERIAMKMGSLRAREAIALSATTHRLSLADLLFIVRGTQEGLMDDGINDIVRSWELRSMLSLARVMADQSVLPSDMSDAVGIYELAIAAFGADSLDERARYVYLETLQSLGMTERLKERIESFDLAACDEVQMTLLECNEILRTTMSSRPAPDSWFEHLNTLYVKAGLAPICYGRDEPDLLDSITAEAEHVENGPLVSVMMATHNGSERIGTAIRSVISQSWRNLELIIVDDCSDKEHWAEIQRHTKLDSRIRVYRLDSNQGAYRARNFAFSKTQGDFITVHDDDDWSHPEKIETQVRHLLANTEVVGNMSFQSRIAEDFQFLRINDNPRFNQRNYSSMLVRRELVEQLGCWDDINRAADAEFHDRVRAVTGQSIVGIETPPLSFMRARSGSLTSGEIRKGALDFARQTFGLLYSAWHHKLIALTAEGGPLAAPSTDPKCRPYVVPANMISGQRVLPKTSTFDVVFVTDFRFPGGNSSLVAVEIEVACKAGLRVGVAQLDSPVLRANHYFNATVHEVLQRLDVPVLTLDDEVIVHLVAIRNPTVLQYAERLRPKFITKNVVIIVNTAPMGRNGSNFCYDLGQCEESARQMFGLDPVVYPESPQTRELNSALFPLVNYAADDWTGFVEPQHFEIIREHDKGRRPVVGRHSRDHALKWPATATEVRQAYVQPGVFDTRIMGGTESIQQIIDLGKEPSVVVLPFGYQEPVEFLTAIDFWVYQHNHALTESFGMAVVESLASGAVAILPAYMEPLFGDAALYATPGEVSSIVKRYWDDADLYRLQSERAREAVRSRFSTDAFIRRLSRLAGKPDIADVKSMELGRVQ
ncbi:glycosyltransferase [Arthrobacter oryzae]|uniref:Glycosyltransferase n=1 Tax=Arthrobacter oryzae TaxID=409290 RepID=A0A3N0BW27_9MICC|nr:glycosyltransferase [Arthrobacter oryzae]RNL53909.1 glycosyltransferase [Arthrobacter oryzae]